MSKPIRKRSEVAAEFTWDLTDIFPSDEAWRAEYEALKALYRSSRRLSGPPR